MAQITGESRQPANNPEGGIFIVCMDRVSLDRFWGSYDNDARWPNKLTVTPGRHYLAVVYSLSKGQRAWWTNVSLDAEAGRRYSIKGNREDMWVEDSATGTIVARATPRTARADRAVEPCP